MNVNRINLNFRSIYKKVENQGKNKFLSAANSEIKRRVLTAQEIMVETFENHPVTMEIDAGPSSSNFSQTLNGYGNLFSFIGFESSEKPTEGLRRLLNEQINIVYRGLLKRGKEMADYRFDILVPSVLELETQTPMPWLNGESWAKGIEEGISGIGQFLAIQAKVSRSGGGIQVKTNFDRTFSTTPYLSKILDSFIKAL